MSMSAVGGESGSKAVADSRRFQPLLVEPTSPAATETIPIELVEKADWQSWISAQDPATQRYLGNSFPSNSTSIPAFHGANAGDICKIMVPVASPSGATLWTVAGICKIAEKNHVYEIVKKPDYLLEEDIDVGWALGSYKYTRFKSCSKDKNNNNKEEVTAAKLVRACKDGKVADSISAATYLVRDIINTPAENYGPDSLEASCRALADIYGAKISVIKGDDLLANNYPQVHAVGRAASDKHAPRLMEIVWNPNGAHKTVTLVGKGVTYDTGGLSIKPTKGMINMKKDLGGAAQCLGLFSLVAENNLNVRMRVLIPAVENSISSNSFRPGDILVARNGLTTLNSNSDAEGRLILADALVAACEDDSAQLVIDMATLTGAQRVAMGPDIPSIFCSDPTVESELWTISKNNHDLVWPMPLYEPYRKLNDSNIADLKSCSDGGYGGAITAALYLQSFVKKDVPWVHMDFMGYNASSKPGRPEGGEAMGMRTMFQYLTNRYGS